MQTTNKNQLQTCRFLSDTEAAELTGIPVSTFRYWRIVQQGPRFYKLGRAVRYEVEELMAWAKSRAFGGGFGGVR